MIMASEAAHLFSTVSSKFVSVQDSHRQAIAAALLEPEDVIWFFSYSGSTRDILDLMELARERKCGLVLVTHYPKSPGAALADVVLQCGASEGPLQLGSVPARMAQLFIIDAVFHEYCRRDVEEMERNRSWWPGLWRKSTSENCRAGRPPGPARQLLSRTESTENPCMRAGVWYDKSTDTL